VPQFRKKPVVIEARQFDGTRESADDICPWAGAQFRFAPEPTPDRKALIPQLVIPTLEGDMRAEPGDWIIKGTKGEFYPCKPDIFEAIYDPA